MERFLSVAQTCIGGLILAIMLWIGSSVQNTRESTIILTASVQNMQEGFDGFKQELSGLRDEISKNINLSLESNRRRIDRLEWRLDAAGVKEEEKNDKH